MNTIPQSYHDKPLIHAWNYCAMDGAPFGVVGRYQDGDGKKDIVPFFKRNGSNWIAGIEFNPRPLFGLDKLADHAKDKAIFIVEGEKSATALHYLGLTALTSLGGSKAAKQADWMPLNGYKRVYLLPDIDQAGEDYIKDVYGSLLALPEPPIIRVLRLEGLPDKGDIVDWLQGWVDNWDGYQLIPDHLHEPLKEKLRDQIKKAVPVPDEWGLDTLDSLDSGGYWGKPNEIKTETPPVQTLQTELIPEPFKIWLDDVSHRMQTPKDFAVISSMVIVGSLIGAGCAIKPKRFDDWQVIPNVWGACIGRPSVVLKTPSMKEPMQLLERLQAEYGELYEKDKAGAEFDGLANKAMIDSVKSDIAKAAKGKGKDGVIQGDDMQKLKADYMQLAESTEPEATRRLFKTNETSVQSMTLLQVQNDRGILVFRDELTGLLVKWDTEQGSDERAYFLEGWNGDGSYTDVKIGRGITDAKSICISLLGGIQPDKLARYLYQAGKGNNDGLVQRLQLAVWPDEPQSWQLIDTKPNKAEKQRAFDIMKALAELDFLQYGATQSEYDERPYFRFDDAGQAIFNEWLTALQTVKIQKEENPLMCEHFGKFRSLMPSLALIFHCIDLADGKTTGNVTAKAAQLAVEWCKYLESHARRIYAMAESPEHEAAVRLADKIKTKCLPSPFTAKDVYRKHWHGLKEKLEIESACNILIEENWLMMQRKPKPLTGRPPLPEYSINPVFL
jgi:hypothetical protein